MDWQFEETNLLNHVSYVHEYVEPIFQTQNRELVDMAQEVYYSTNGFTIYPFMDYARGNNPQIDYPNPKHTHLVQRLVVRFEPCTIPEMADDTLFRKNDAWRLLLR
jgi:hypothetical protein